LNIIGIDPGLNNTGVGVLKVENKALTCLYFEVIKTNPKESLPLRLKQICTQLTDIIDKFSPEYAAVEDVFYSVNIKSALLLGHTRGAIMATLLSKGVKVHEFTALQIKKSVVGYGKADKEQVRKMVELHLNLKFDKEKYDISDALGCALCLGLNITGGYFGLQN
jgi:crossover junction endodeoxyribonuclease RuvC